MNSLLCGTLISTVTLTMAMPPTWAGEDAADSALNARVRTALQADLGSGAIQVDVDSYGGTVRLRGRVATHALWRSAQESAADVYGVNHVLNEMEHGGNPSLSVK